MIAALGLTCLRSVPTHRPQGNAGRRIASVDNKAIAETLGISATTVRNHIEHLLAKLGVHSKLEAVVYAAKSGLL